MSGVYLPFFLFLLLGASCSGDPALQRPLNWPCPEETDIFPCVCTADEGGDLDLDCSRVISEDQLAEIFRTNMPFSDFRLLNITRTDPPPGLHRLPSGVFGSATFRHVVVTGTYIVSVEEGALIGSRATLLALELQNNGLTYFPFETLPLFTGLRHLDLANNNIRDLPDVSSVSMRFLSLAGNLGLSLTSSTFKQARKLEYLNLHDVLLWDIPPNVFSRLENIRTLKLSKNGFSSTLTDHFVNNPLNTLEVLDLHDNYIPDIHRMAITGLRKTATVNFRYNKIKELQQEKWEALLDQVNQINAIDLRGNSLECGCDVYWLVLNSTLLSRVHEETTCHNGSYLHDIPLDYFLEHCPDGPET